MFDINIPLPTFFLLCGLLIAMVAVYAMNLKKGNDYSALDLLRDGDPPRASLTKHILLGSWLLSVWLVVMRTLDHENKIPPSVDGLLLGMLGVFVLNKVGSEAVYRFSKRPQNQPSIVDSAQNVTIEPPPRN